MSIIKFIKIYSYNSKYEIHIGVVSLIVAVLILALGIPGPLLAKALINSSGDDRTIDFPTRVPELPAEPLLEDYIALGLINSPDLRAAYERYRAAVERVILAKSLPDPRIMISQAGEEVQTRTGPQENQLALSQTIPWLGKLHHKKEAAQGEADALWSLFEARKLAVERDIKIEYFEYAYLSKATLLTEENLKLLKKVEPVVQDKVKSGGSLNQLLRLQVEIGRLEDHLNSLQRQRPIISVRLNVLINRERKELLPWPDLAEVDFHPRIEVNYGGKIEEKNPELQSIHERIHAQENRKRVADLQRFPDMTVGFNYINTGTALNSETLGSGEDPWAVTFSFNVPLWWAKNRAAQNEALSEKRFLESAIIHKQNQIESDFTAFLQRSIEARDRAEIFSESLLPTARQAIAVTEMAYQSGQASILDYIDSQRTLLELETTFWRAVADCHQNLARMEALYGGEI